MGRLIWRLRVNITFGNISVARWFKKNLDLSQPLLHKVVSSTHYNGENIWDNGCIAYNKVLMELYVIVLLITLLLVWTNILTFWGATCGISISTFSFLKPWIVHIAKSKDNALKGTIFFFWNARISFIYIPYLIQQRVRVNWAKQKQQALCSTLYLHDHNRPYYFF